jgi:hypothetical protein
MTRGAETPLQAASSGGRRHRVNGGTAAPLAGSATETMCADSNN